MTSYRVISTDDYLAHHGILGQKWGVRRYQNPDGSLTPAGEKRYNVENAKNEYKKAKAEAKQATNEYNKKTNYGLIYNKKATDKLLKANGRAQLAKENITNQKVKNKISDEKSKSKHRLKLEQKYLDKGMSQEEAAIAAYKRAKTEKILAITAGVTIAAAASYVAYKHYDDVTDKIIKPGTVISRISSTSDAGVHDAFYAAINKKDANKYAGMYANTLKLQGKEAYQKTLDALDSLKVASDKSGKNVLTDLINNDSNFKKKVLDNMIQTYNSMDYNNASPNQMKAFNKGVESLRKGIVDKNVYNAFNYTLTYKDDTSKRFYDELKKAGYSGIVDVNDKKLSGYFSKQPVIIFESGKTAVSNVRKLGEEEISKNLNKAIFETTVKQLAPQVAGNAAIVAAIAGANKVMTSKSRDKIVSDYKKKHPDSNLSYNEILKNYYS